MPSYEAQVDVISKAYAQAGIDPKHTSYVEAHGTFNTPHTSLQLAHLISFSTVGTGTKVGDKIEAEAIAKSFTSERTENSPLFVGSIKTNVGHTESTSGLASFLKAVLILENGIIPPNLNYASTNKEIPLEKWHIKVSIHSLCLSLENNRLISASDSAEENPMAGQPSQESFS